MNPNSATSNHRKRPLTKEGRRDQAKYIDGNTITKKLAQIEMNKNENKVKPFQHIEEGNGCITRSMRLANPYAPSTIIINDKKLEYKMRKEHNERLMWGHTTHMAQKRKEHLREEQISMPQKSQLNQFIPHLKNRMRQMVAWHLHKGLDRQHLKLAQEHMDESFQNSTDTIRREAARRIEQIIENAISSNVLPAEARRMELKINHKVSVFANESLDRSEMEKMEAKMSFDYIDKNIITINGINKTLLKTNEKKIACKCVGGECDKSCSCFKIDTVIRNKRVNHGHTCSLECSCKGQCKNSLPKCPENGVETVIHPSFLKGATNRALQYFGKNEVVMEFRGELKECPDDDSAARDYEMDMWNSSNQDYVLDCLEINSKRESKGEPPLVHGFSASYKKEIKNLLARSFMIDPETQGGEGRYIASSCLGNLQPHTIYSKGLNPANAKIVMVSKFPIFPGQELSFFYSFPYIFEKFGNGCLCGQLCCVANMDLFPFVTDKDIIEYFRKLYEHSFTQWRTHVNIS